MAGLQQMEFFILQSTTLWDDENQSCFMLKRVFDRSSYQCVTTPDKILMVGIGRDDWTGDESVDAGDATEDVDESSIGSGTSFVDGPGTVVVAVAVDVDAVVCGEPSSSTIFFIWTIKLRLDQGSVYVLAWWNVVTKTSSFAHWLSRGLRVDVTRPSNLCPFRRCSVSKSEIWYAYLEAIESGPMYCTCAISRLQFSGRPTCDAWMCLTRKRNRFPSHM